MAVNHKTQAHTPHTAPTAYAPPPHTCCSHLQQDACQAPHPPALHPTAPHPTVPLTTFSTLLGVVWQLLFDLQIARRGRTFVPPTRAMGFSVDLRGSHVAKSYIGNAFVGVFALPPVWTGGCGGPGGASWVRKGVMKKEGGGMELVDEPEATVVAGTVADLGKGINGAAQGVSKGIVQGAASVGVHVIQEEEEGGFSSTSCVSDGSPTPPTTPCTPWKTTTMMRNNTQDAQVTTQREHHAHNDTHNDTQATHQVKQHTQHLDITPQQAQQVKQVSALAHAVRAATVAARSDHVGGRLLQLLHGEQPYSTLHTMLYAANVQHAYVGQVCVWGGMIVDCCVHACSIMYIRHCSTINTILSSIPSLITPTPTQQHTGHQLVVLSP